MIDRTHLREVLSSLDANQLRRRLDELDGERAAVMTLLRAARARERAHPATRRRRRFQAGRASRGLPLSWRTWPGVPVRSSNGAGRDDATTPARLGLHCYD